MNEITVTYYFTSGKSMDVKYSQDKFLEFVKKIGHGWNTCSSVGIEFGINFALVTHYEVK